MRQSNSTHGASKSCKDAPEFLADHFRGYVHQNQQREPQIVPVGPDFTVNQASQLGRHLPRPDELPEESSFLSKPFSPERLVSVVANAGPK